MGWTVRLSLVIAAWALAGACAAAGYKPPRTSDGRPDLEGVWDSATLTPVQRPPEFKSLVVPEADAVAYERRMNDPQALDADFHKRFPNAPDVGAVQTEWDYTAHNRLARIGGQARGAILIDPPDGQLPIRPDVRPALRERRLRDLRTFDAAEDRPLGERCLLIGGPPLLSGDTIQIVQTRDHVVLSLEYDHMVRIVRLSDHRPTPTAVTPWMGDSTGWWEGDTLVVETTRFNPGHLHWVLGARMPISPSARVTERFSRTSGGEILYRFTVDDPAIYARPWSGVLPLTATRKRQFEYACHEGNYALPGILAGARLAEREGRTPEPLDGGDPPPKPAAATP
ncbi:MAG TPA: hypothetical protein VF495_05340 [Phenylobacterium sp.]